MVVYGSVDVAQGGGSATGNVVVPSGATSASIHAIVFFTVNNDEFNTFDGYPPGVQASISKGNSSTEETERTFGNGSVQVELNRTSNVPGTYSLSAISLSGRSHGLVDGIFTTFDVDADVTIDESRSTIYAIYET